MNDRTKSIGASEVAALFGCHPWESEYSLWCKKTGLVAAREDTERLAAGRYLERAIFAEWCAREGFDENATGLCAPYLEWNDIAVFHDTYAFISATPDGVGAEPFDDENGKTEWNEIVADVKTVTQQRRADWNDGVPNYYVLQVQQQMLVTTAGRGVLIAQFGFDELSHEWIEADPVVQDEITKRCVTFWKRVQGELPPPDPDEHPATTAALRRRAIDGEKSIALGPDVREWSDELGMLERQTKVLGDEMQLLKNKIRAAMGDACRGVWPDGTGWVIRQQPATEFVTKKKAHMVMARIKSKEAISENEE